MTDKTDIEIVPPDISGDTDGLKKRDGEDPVPLLGKRAAGVTDSGGRVDTSTYPNVELHVNVDVGDAEVRRFERRHFTIYEEGETKEIERFEFLNDELDLVFVFDDTGSMSNEIEGAKAGVTELTDTIDEQDVDSQYALVTFKDSVDVKTRLTRDADELTSEVDKLMASAGGDAPEANLDAIERALDLDFRESAQQVFVDITDAPTHFRGDGSGFSEYVLDEVATDLSEEGITFISVGPNMDDERASIKTLAGRVGGFWTDIREVREKGAAGFREVLQRITSLFTSTYVLGFHTCTPPGENRPVAVEFDHPRYGSAMAGTNMSIPGEFELPPECEEQEQELDEVDVFLEADRYVLGVGERVKLTARTGDGERLSAATVRHGGESTTTDERGTAEWQFEESGPKELTVDHDAATGTASVTIDVEGDDGADSITRSVDGIDVEGDDGADSITRSVDGIDVSGSTGEGGDGSGSGSGSGPTSLILEPDLWEPLPGEEMKFTVRDIDGNRVAGVTVEAGDERAETDSRGVCHLTVEGDDRIEVTATKPDGNYEADSVELDIREN